MRFSAVIFDFDGTLCDTGPGIMNSAAYALEAYGFEVPREPGALRCFIGPPLLVTFQEQFGADAATAQALVQKYRERYNGAILNESMLYRGIVTLLENLKAAGIRIGIASSKPKRYIDQLLAHFTIDKFFDAVCGVDFKTDCESKASIIARCLQELGAAPETALMVGDKSYDINGGKANGLKTVGVNWGYGSKFEFIEAGADFQAEKPMDIEAIALGFFEQTEEYGGIYNGRILTLHCDTVTMVDGAEEKREVIDHPGGVAVAGLTENNELLLVRQFRYPYKEILLEIPAGKLEKGEDPFEAAKRELEEECGLTADKYTSLGEFYPTVGYDTEIIYTWVATGLHETRMHLDADVFLTPDRVPLTQAYEMVMRGEIKDGKTIAGVLKLKALLDEGKL